MSGKTATHAANPASTSITTQAQSLVSRREVDKQTNKPLEQPIWQPAAPTTSVAGMPTPPTVGNTGHNFANISVLAPSPINVQARLTVGAPDDKYEQEADQVADTVMRMPEPIGQGRPDDNEDDGAEEQIQTKPIAEQITPFVQRQAYEGQDEEEEPIQTKSLLQRQEQPEEEEEEPLQTKPSLQRQEEPEEEEETVQAKPLIQRQEQPEEEEEEPVQTKPALQRQEEPEEEEEEPVQTKPSLQRQEEPEEEEEAVQTKPLIQRQEQPEEEEEAVQAKSVIQRQEQPEEEEEEPVQTKPSLQRQEEEEEPLQTKSLLQRQEGPEEDEEELVQTKPSLQRQEEPEEEEPIQQKSFNKPVSNYPRIHNIARQGVRYATQPLPHIHQIQKSFGKHSLSGVRVQIGGPALKASRGLNARAYAQGNRIAFKEYPDLKLAAHEAAHIIQQRRGIRLSDGIGKAGDPFEQHADQVADAVVAGRSTEALLNINPLQETAKPGLQMACDCGGGGCAKCNPKSDEEAIQTKLEVNATRQFVSAEAEEKAMAEAAAIEAEGEQETEGEESVEETAFEIPEEKEQGSALDAAGETETEITDTEEEEEDDVAERDEFRLGQQQNPNPDAPTADYPETVQFACDGQGAVNAAKYEAGMEEPEEEPDEQPPEPKPTDSKQDMDSDSPDAEIIDICPIDEAIEAKSATAVPTEGSISKFAQARGPQPQRGAARRRASGGKRGESTPETEAMEGAAKANAEEGKDAVVPVARAIAQTEAQRSAAVSAYANSSATLQTVTQPINEMASNVTFAEEEELGLEGVTRQASATSRAQSFFTDASMHVEAMTSMMLGDMPLRIGELSETIKAGITGSMGTEAGNIMARISRAKASAYAQTRAAKNNVTQSHATNIAAMDKSTNDAIQKLRDEHKTVTSTINKRETKGLGQINTHYRTARTAHENVGKAVGRAATSRGEEYAVGYKAHRKSTSDGFWIGYLTDRRAVAQMKAARETAKGYSKSLTEAANKQASELVKGRQKDRCAMIATARKARKTLDDQFASLEGSLRAGFEQAVNNANTQRDQLKQSADDALSATLRTLTQQEEAQLQALNDAGYLQQVATEQIAHAAAASIQGSAIDAISLLTTALQQINLTLTSFPAPEHKHLEPILSEAASAFGSGVENINIQLDGAVGVTQERMNQMGVSAGEALAGVTQSNDEQASSISKGTAQTMRSLAKNAKTSFEGQSDQYKTQTTDVAAKGVTGLQKIGQGFETAATTTETGVKTTLTESAKRLEESLCGKIAEMDTEIPKQANRAASKEAPAWKTVVAVLLIIAIIIVVALVIGPAVIGAVGAAAGALGASAATAAVIGTIVGGAIVGAATSAAIQVINNWRTNTDLMEGVGKAAIMGAIGGAFGAGAGMLIGKTISSVAMQFAANIVADAVLEVGISLVTGEFSWEALGMAVLMSAVTGGFGEIPRVKRIQGRMQHRGAKSVPGKGAKGYADSIRPADVGGGTTPKADSDVGTTPKADSDVGTTPKADSDVGTTPKADSDTGTTPKTDSDTGTTPKADSDADAGSTTKTDTEESGPRQTGSEEDVVIIRQDNDFKAQVNHKGKPKSHLDDSGSLVPNNPNGKASPLEHIYGMDPAKSDSPFTSFLSKSGSAKTYGDLEIELNVTKLQTDIASGKLKDVEVLPPSKIAADIEADIKVVVGDVEVDIPAAIAKGPDGIAEYVGNLPISKGKARKLSRRLLAYHNTTRDGEYLIRGVVPAEYINGPKPTSGGGGGGGGTPRSDAGGGGTTPRTEGDTGTTPTTRTEGDTGTTPTTRTEGDTGTTPTTKVEGDSDVPVQQLSNTKLQEAAVSTKIGDIEHTIKPVNIDGEVKLVICTTCGTLTAKIDDVLKQVSPKGPTKSLFKRLTKLKGRVSNIETGLNKGTIPFNRIPAEANQVGAHLNNLAKKNPDFGAALNTTKQIKPSPSDYADLATKLDFSSTNARSHGQAVFTDGKIYITPDIDSHIGGVWKAADSVRNLGSKRTRMGTYDEKMNRIGD